MSEIQGSLDALTAPDWEVRLASVLRLKTLLAKRKSQDVIETLLRNHSALAAQLLQLRTAISKETGCLLQRIAEQYAFEAEPLLQKIVTRDVLIKGLSSGNKLLASTSFSCLKSICTHCPSSRILVRLAEETGVTKNGFVKSRCLEATLSLFKGMKHSERDLAVVERLIASNICDASGEVRQFARLMFLDLQKVSAAGAGRLSSTFSSATVAALDAHRSEDATLPVTNIRQYKREQVRNITGPLKVLPPQIQTPTLVIEQPQLQVPRSTKTRGSDRPEKQRPRNRSLEERGEADWQESDLSYLIEKARDQNWAIRKTAFQKLSQLLRNEGKVIQSKKQGSLLHSLLDLVLEGLQETNPKILAEVLGTLPPLLPLLKGWVPILDRLVPRVLMASGQGDRIGLLAQGVLESLRAMFGQQYQSRMLKLLGGERGGIRQRVLLEVLGVCREQYSSVKVLEEVCQLPKKQIAVILQCLFQVHGKTLLEEISSHREVNLFYETMCTYGLGHLAAQLRTLHQREDSKQESRPKSPEAKIGQEAAKRKESPSSPSRPARQLVVAADRFSLGRSSLKQVLAADFLQGQLTAAEAVALVSLYQLSGKQSELEQLDSSINLLIRQKKTIDAELVKVLAERAADSAEDYAMLYVKKLQLVLASRARAELKPFLQMVAEAASKAIRSSNSEARRGGVFLMAQLQIKFKEEKLLSGLEASQKQLVQIYMEKKRKALRELGRDLG